VCEAAAVCHTRRQEARETRTRRAGSLEATTKASSCCSSVSLPFLSPFSLATGSAVSIQSTRTAHISRGSVFYAASLQTAGIGSGSCCFNIVRKVSRPSSPSLFKRSSFSSSFSTSSFAASYPSSPLSTIPTPSTANSPTT
jgi:hypothetical protein